MDLYKTRFGFSVGDKPYENINSIDVKDVQNISICFFNNYF